MENKQIVDDVQIRGCGHYWNGTCHAYTDNTGKFLLCVNSPHCYFKQLALKEQECIALREEKVYTDMACEQFKKQLQSKEQESKEFKKQLERKEENYQKLLSKSNKYIHNLVDENVQDISNLARRLEQFKVENEKFKKQVCSLRPELKSIINKTCCKYNIEAKTYHKKIVEIINNLDKYKQTLTKIKEICENNDELQGDFNVVDCDKYKLGKHNLANKIIQKISECEVKYEN